MQPTKSFAIPLSFIGIMFFSLGFALGINSLLVPVLQGSLGISNAASYLIIAATFIPFLIFGYPAGLTIKAIGYKKTMSLSFVIFAAAFYLFILSADEKSFPLFLLASIVTITKQFLLFLRAKSMQTLISSRMTNMVSNHLLS
jgi:MFS transporter, FHS family, L-fucose permease